MTFCKLIPNMPALTDCGFGILFKYLMLAASEHSIKSILIKNGTEFWALSQPVEPPESDPDQEFSRGIMCEIAEKEFEKILKNKDTIAFHVKLLSPGGTRRFIEVVVNAKGKEKTFETLNDFFDWLPVHTGPEEIKADDTSRWLRDLFRTNGVGFIAVNVDSHIALVFHHDMIDLVDLDGENTWKANFYGNCDLKKKIKQDDEGFKEYIGLLCSAIDDN